jgi:fatty acid desaturase
MRAAIRNLFNRFIAALFFLQGTGWLFGFGETVQAFAQSHPTLTGILIVVYLIYCHIVWDLERERQKAKFTQGARRNRKRDRRE